MRYLSVALAALAVVAPLPGMARSLEIAIQPGPDIEAAQFCSVILNDDSFSLMSGPGLGPFGHATAPRSPARDAAFLAVIDTFLTGKLPSGDRNDVTIPDYPFVVITWTAVVGDDLPTGMLVMPGLTLPPSVDAVVRDLFGDTCVATLPVG